MREVVIPGWVGFDGGAKRAISFARTPRPKDDPIEPTERLIATLDVLGYTPPPCYRDPAADSPPDNPGMIAYALWTFGALDGADGSYADASPTGPWTFLIETPGSTSGAIYNAPGCAPGAFEGYAVGGWAALVTVTELIPPDVGYPGHYEFSGEHYLTPDPVLYATGPRDEWVTLTIGTGQVRFRWT